jgi:hypothetical protein
MLYNRQIHVYTHKSSDSIPHHRQHRQIQSAQGISITKLSVDMAQGCKTKCSARQYKILYIRCQQKLVESYPIRSDVCTKIKLLPFLDY